MADYIEEFLEAMRPPEVKTNTTYSAVVSSIDDEGTIWVNVAGSNIETPTSTTSSEVSVGDYVNVKWRNNRLYIAGNISNPAAGVVRVDAVEKAATQARTAADSAVASAQVAQEAADRAIGYAEELEEAVEEIDENVATLQQRVSDAQDDIDDALEGLALAENVVGTLNWLTAHSQLTTDTTPVSGKSYYIKHQDGTFEIVTDTTGKNPAQEGWYEMDEAISNYVAAHLSLTNYGLNLTLDNNSYRIHIGTLTASGDDGVYVIDGEGHVVTYFGESIKFDDDYPFHIGNENNYILWNPIQNRIEIGGNVLMGSDKTLSEVLAEINGTLVFDTSYEYNNWNSANGSVTFTAHVYRGGVEVTSEFTANEFSWYLKTEDGEVSKGNGLTKVFLRTECGYGAEVIAKFTPPNNAEALNNEGDNLTNVNNAPLTVQATGDKVRVRDLTVSTTIYSTDKLMVIGGEDEHLVSIETLQDYLNANLDKQVLFNTTAGWNAQTTLVSDANTLYVYTDHQTDSQGNNVAGIKAGDGSAYVVDLPFTDAIATEHIADTTRHITSAERNFWNNKVRCYYASGDNLIFTTA